MTDPYNDHGVPDDDLINEEELLKMVTGESNPRARRRGPFMPLPLQKQFNEKLDGYWWPSNLPF